MRIDIEGMTLEDVARRWPRLLRAMRWAGPLTEPEAACAVLCYKGFGLIDSGSEALSHLGRNLQAIRGGINGRHRARKARRAGDRTRVIEAALEAFWAKVAESYPQVRVSGLSEDAALDLVLVADSAIDSCLTRGASALAASRGRA